MLSSSQGQTNESQKTGTFRFMTETGVVMWTGYLAEDLPSLLHGLRQVPGSSIYYHAFHAIFRRPKYTRGECSNDFARWVYTVLGQKGLAEKLAGLDPLEYSTIRQYRDQLTACVQEYVAEGELFPRVPSGRELYFLEARSFVFPAGTEATDVPELASAIEKMGAGCLIYHFIEARLRNGGKTNDFSHWLRLQGAEEKAQALEHLNPYFYDLEELKYQIVEVLRS
jgi:hypothetical protein